MYSPEFEESAKLLLDDTTSSVTPALKYNIACLYAQAVQFGPREKQEEFSLKAISFLTELMNTTDYFRPKANILHLDGDTDLDPIRNRPDYRKFRMDVEARAGNGVNEESGTQAPENPMPPGKK
jgi:hypothetical protein